MTPTLAQGAIPLKTQARKDRDTLISDTVARLEACGCSEAAETVRSCCRQWTLLYCSPSKVPDACETPSLVAQHCDHQLCPVCAERRARRNAETTAELVKASGARRRDLVVLTLTQRGRDGEPVREAWERFTARWSRVQKHWRWKELVTGGVVGFEVAGEHGNHVHAHLLCETTAYLPMFRALDHRSPYQALVSQLGTLKSLQGVIGKTGRAIGAAKRAVTVAAEKLADAERSGEEVKRLVERLVERRQTLLRRRRRLESAQDAFRRLATIEALWCLAADADPAVVGWICHVSAIKSRKQLVKACKEVAKYSCKPSALEDAPLAEFVDLFCGRKRRLFRRFGAWRKLRVERRKGQCPHCLKEGSLEHCGDVLREARRIAELGGLSAFDDRRRCSSDGRLDASEFTFTDALYSANLILDALWIELHRANDSPWRTARLKDLERRVLEIAADWPSGIRRRAQVKDLP